MINIEPNQSFYEFVRWAANNFEEPASKEWADSWFNSINNDIHNGDCTNHPYTCNICLLESFLNEYAEYYFNYENWKKNI